MYLEEADDIFCSLFDGADGFISSYNKEEKIKQIITSNKGLLFKPKNIDKNAIDKIKQTIEELKEKGMVLDNKFVGVDYAINKPYLTATDCNILKEFETFIKASGAEFVIVAEDLFYVEDIIRTNSKLDAEVEYIESLTVPTEKNRPLNDMEKFLMVYDFCTNFKYQEDEHNLSFSRNLTSILNSTSIVCVGYAELMKEMCSRLGIECYCQSSTIYDKKTGEELGGHANNLVVLEGKVYYADACWDCQRPKTQGLKLYNHCLIPVKDKNNFKKEKVEYCKSHLSDLKQNKREVLEYLRQLNANEEINNDMFTLMSWDYNDVLADKTFKSKIEWDMKTMSYHEYAKLRDQDEAKQQLEEIINYLNKYEYGEAIPYEIFEQSLINIYRAKGMSEKAAQSLLERTMNINERRAKKCFNENAGNCFVAGRTQELEI